MSEKMKKCPKCGGIKFRATAHVTQDWEVDRNGNFVKSLNDCVEVTHFPDNDDIWDCANCGYSAAGIEFEVSADDTSNETPNAENLNNGCTKILIRVRGGLVESVYCSDMNAEVYVEDLDILEEEKDDDSGFWLDGSPIDETKLTQLY